MRRTTGWAALLLVLVGSSTALAVEPPPLDKVTAAKILGFMGCTDITVKAVVQGVGNFGSSASTAMVLADSGRGETRSGSHYSFVYDSDLGWFYYEVPSGMDDKEKRLRIWTVKGYQETTRASGKPTSRPAPSGFDLIEPGVPGGLLRVYPPEGVREIKQGQTGIVEVASSRGAGYKHEVKLEIKAPPGLQVDPSSAVLKPSDLFVQIKVKLTAAKDAPVGESKILVKGTPDKGEPMELEFKVRVIANAGWRVDDSPPPDPPAFVPAHPVPLSVTRPASLRRNEPGGNVGSGTFKITSPIAPPDFIQGETHFVYVNVVADRGTKPKVELAVEASTGLNVTLDKTTVKPNDTGEAQLTIKVAKDAPIGESYIVLKGTSETGQTAVMRFKVRTTTPPEPKARRGLLGR